KKIVLTGIGLLVWGIAILVWIRLGKVAKEATERVMAEVRAEQARKAYEHKLEQAWERANEMRQRYPLTGRDERDPFGQLIPHRYTYCEFTIDGVNVDADGVIRDYSFCISNSKGVWCGYNTVADACKAIDDCWFRHWMK